MKRAGMLSKINALLRATNTSLVQNQTAVIKTYIHIIVSICK